MKDGKVDRFIDKLIPLGAVLRYSGEFVTARACMAFARCP